MKQLLFKRGLVLFLVITTYSIASAQLSYAPNTLSDGNGNPIMTKKAVVPEATYLFDNNYLNAVIYLSSGKPILGHKFKLNLQRNILYYIDENGNEMEVVSPVKRIEFLPSPGREPSVVFERGFPPIEKQTNNNFYQVLVAGKAQLLMDTKFDEVEYKEYNSASTTHRTDKLISYYGVNGNTIAHITRPDDLLLLFSDKTKLVSDYLKKENIKPKKQADFEKVFQYYNSLEK